MKFAIVGTGFVADYYMTTLPNHPGLQLAGAWDIAPDALRRFCAYHGVQPRGSLDDILCDPQIGIVANLTAPESHFAVTKAALEAGKHVYSEKPLTLSFDDATELAACASRNGLALGSSPASVHSAAFALTRDTIASGAIGEPRLIYAEMEDGPVFRDKWREWRSISGAPWPGVHEFEIGCTLEHAGYALAWLVDLFGPVAKVTAFSATAFPDKGVRRDHPVGHDFSVGGLFFASGPVARLTSGLTARKDRSMTIHGAEGSLHVADLWDDRSPIRLRRADARRGVLERIAGRVEARRGHVLPFSFAEGKRLRYPAQSARRLPAFPSQIDFSAGVAALAQTVEAGDPQRFRAVTARSLHLCELTLALQDSADRAAHTLRTTLP